MFLINNRRFGCPLELAIAVIGGKWKILIAMFLRHGARRYSEIHRYLETASHKVLAEQLRELEADGILVRTAFPSIPPRVEYALTDVGQRLVPHLLGMAEWGMQFYTGDPVEAAEVVERLRTARTALQT